MKNQADVLRDTRNFQLTYRQRRRFSYPGMNAFLKITEKWGLTRKEQMALFGMKSFNKFAEVRTGKRLLTSIELEIISKVLRIYKCLHVLLPSDADKWIRKPNDMFDGDSALDHVLGKEKVKMVSVGRLVFVKDYLEAECA